MREKPAQDFGGASAGFSDHRGFQYDPQIELQK
jgi:hypothetical protein